MILKSGMILLARRAPGRKHEGKWEFPGGRVEDGETPAAALARELKEELGIEAQVGAEAARTRHAYDFGEIELIAHLVPRFSGEITLKDHDKIAWVEARKLLEYDLAPADVPITEAVAAHRRRGRYKGTHPTEFSDKYKELAADPDAVAKAKARGSTPAGMHVAIMVAEVLEALSPPAGAVVLDCTLGFGGHAEALARRGARVVALDRDAEELARTAARLASLGLPIETVHSDYARAEDVLAGRAVDGVLADLGVSSMQLDRPERGMSFKRDGPLDMRMDRTSGETAAAWIARVAESELSRALSLYGDEPDAAKIAASLKTRPPRTTFELAALVSEAKGLGAGRVAKKDASSFHPAARTFQALRIAVNGERASLERLLADLPSIVKRGGRAVFLTFHSGEERLVAAALEDAALWRLDAPRKASPEEIRQNPRARSARLWRAVRA